MLSRRSAVPASDSPLFQAVAARRQSGEALVDLTVTNPTKVGLGDEPARALAPLADPRAAVYESDAFGVEEARQAIAEEWARRGVAVDVARIALTASTSEAYAHCFRLLCDPGDEVLVPRPSYPLIDEIARYESARLVPYQLAYDGAWHVDLASVRAAMGPRTRAIVAISPHNPTGYRLTDGDVRALGGLGVPLVVDEVFAAYPVEGLGVSSALSVTDAPLIVLDGLSKLAALPQMKVAWMTLGGPASFVEESLRRLEVMLDAFLSVGTPAALAVDAWLRGAPGTQWRIRQRLSDNLAVLRGALADGPATVPRVEAGWYAMVRVPALLTDEQWARRLLDGAGVLVHPGWLYDVTQEAWLVVSLLTPPEDMRRGAQGIAEIVAEVVR